VKNIRRIGLSLVLAVLLLVSLTVPALATNPTVTITISAQITSITNTHDAWTAPAVIAGGAAIYWSADGYTQDDDYSEIENTGNVAVDVQIQGTDFEGGAYDWTLGASAGDKTYSLYSNNSTNPTVYDIQVKKASYAYVAWNLPATGSDKTQWSMKLTPPTIFDVADDGSSKTATVTLVAAKHT
jgi:hypothetical protein